MTFILRILDRPDMSHVERSIRFEEYYAYLEAIRDLLPPSAYDFAVADWHYDFGDPRCPHDAWLQNLSMKVTVSGTRSEVRRLDIYMKLLDAQHNGYINLHYSYVYDFSLIGPFDWYYDEIRLSKEGSLGRVTHEIRGSGDTHWIIVCDDISYRWEPLPKNRD